MLGLLDSLTRIFGRFICWFCLCIVLTQFGIVVARYVFSSGSVAWQEGVVFLHAVFVLIAVVVALSTNKHVRVDVLYEQFSPRLQASIDLFGYLFFVVPFAVFTAWYGMPYILQSWAVYEGSNDPQGLGYVYILKSFLLLFSLLIGSQGLAGALRAVMVLRVHAS